MEFIVHTAVYCWLAISNQESELSSVVSVKCNKFEEFLAQLELHEIQGRFFFFLHTTIIFNYILINQRNK